MASTGIHVTPLTSVIGARVDLESGAELLDPGAIRAIREALLEHLVLVLPDQALAPEQQWAFASSFGEPEPHPVSRFFGSEETIVRIDNELIALPDHGRLPHLDHLAEHGAWHADYSFNATIPEFATLRAEIVPPIGGDTSWASMVAAYESLSPVMRGLLDGLDAVHWHGPHFAPNFGVARHGDDALRRFEAAFPPIEHPMVILHPETGRRSLFVNPSYTVRIPAMTRSESDAMLRFLFHHIAKSEFHFRHHWQTDDLVIWDERATVHLAPTDYESHPRELVRVAIGSVAPKR